MRERLGRLRSDEAGFSLVEIMVASGVILVSLTLLASVLTAGLKASGIARQRQSATGLANRAIEQIRSLPFQTVERGLDVTDITNSQDPNITSNGCDTASCFNGERIVNGTNAPVEPLVPHRRATTIGPTDFTISAYVTNYMNVTTSPTYRVTVHVSWTNVLRGGLSEQLEAQTLIHATADCLSLAVHPRSGPCEPSFNSSAISDPGSIAIRGTLGGLSVDNVTLFSSSSSSEQTTRVEGLTQMSGAKLRAVGGSDETIGRTSVVSAADNDPSEVLTEYQSADVPSQAAISRVLSLGADSLTVNGSAGDSGRTTSTTNASTSSAPARLCPNITGLTNDNDSLPCGGSTARTASTITAQAHIATGSVGGLALASIGPAVNPNVTTTDRYATTGDGAIRAGVSRPALSYNLVGLPTLLRPTGFDYFVKLNSYADSTTSQGGIGTSAPSATSSGTLSFYSGGLLDPYTTINVSAVTASTVIPTLNLSFPALGVQVTLTATLTPETRTLTATTAPAGCTGTCTRTSSTAVVTPLKVTVNAQITLLGMPLVNTTLSLDPGTIQAKSTYNPAPSS
ncbi:MAG: hypothetical protein WD826_06585 [Actinomycetota bacterium]